VAVVAATIILVVAALLWLGSRVSVTLPSPAISGVVVLDTGPPLGSRQAVHPIRHAAMAITGSTTLGIRVVRYFRADRRGRFSLRVPPGVYVVTAVVDGSPTMGGQPHEEIMVAGGHPIHVRLHAAGI
jgi:hypothetical protein